MNSNELVREMAKHDEKNVDQRLVYIPMDFGPEQGPLGEFAHSGAPKDLVEQQFPAARFEYQEVTNGFKVLNWVEALEDRGLPKPAAWKVQKSHDL